jgi:hypothetical protein
MVGGDRRRGVGEGPSGGGAGSGGGDEVSGRGDVVRSVLLHGGGGRDVLVRGGGGRGVLARDDGVHGGGGGDVLARDGGVRDLLVRNRGGHAEEEDGAHLAPLAHREGMEDYGPPRPLVVQKGEEEGAGDLVRAWGVHGLGGRKGAGDDIRGNDDPPPCPLCRAPCHDASPYLQGSKGGSLRKRLGTSTLEGGSWGGKLPQGEGLVGAGFGGR